MLWLLSWKNIWRNKLRSLIILGALGLGLTGGVFYLAFSNSMGVQRVDEGIKTEVSDIQIHLPAYMDNPEISLTIPLADSLKQALAGMQNIEAVASRIKIGGMASSALSGAGVVVYGIDPEQEMRVTDLHTKVIQGSYIGAAGRNPVFIGEKLAQKLKVKLNSKIVLTFQDVNNSIVGGAFKVVGIYKTFNARFDEMNMFIRASDLRVLTGMEPSQVHEIACMVYNRKLFKLSVAAIQAHHPDLLVQSWKGISAELAMIDSMASTKVFIFIYIILFALSFGIINTMLMAVMERTREIGMLMAIGMKQSLVFAMIMLETVMLCSTGGIAGSTAAGIIVAITSKTGIHFTFASAAFQNY
jgi:ABC-type lipoprotein release transport system permease subunit